MAEAIKTLINDQMYSTWFGVGGSKVMVSMLGPFPAELFDALRKESFLFNKCISLPQLSKPPLKLYSLLIMQH